MITKLARAPKGGGSARGGIRYILGYELAEKSQPSRDAYHALIGEAMMREDAGVGTVWSPAAGQGRRPSSILAVNIGSMATAAIEMEAVARANVRVKMPIHHLIYSWSESETASFSDEQMLRAVEDHLKRIGLGDHQAVLSVHRDTNHGHVHAAVGVVNPFTLKAWNTTRHHYRIAWQAREVEATHGFAHDRGAAVWDEVTQSVRWANSKEKAAWRRESTEQRLDDYTRRTLDDHAGLETRETYAMTLAVRIGRELRDVQARSEKLHAADVHLIAAQMGARVRVIDGRLQVTLLSRIERESRPTDDTQHESRDADEQAKSPTRYQPRDVLQIDLRDVVGDTDEDAGDSAKRKRLHFMETLEDAAAAEESYAAMVRADPGLVSRGIVARGRATFGTDDIYGELSARVSDSAVVDELRMQIEREDTTLLVLTGDTEQPLYSTIEQHALELRVRAKVDQLAQLRDESFDARALTEAIRRVEAERGYSLSDEQLAIVQSIQYRISPTQGDAGTGKTTAMAVLGKYAKITGRDIVGLSTSERATRALADAAGIRGMNVARADVREAGGERTYDDGAIVIYDESSMLDLAAFDKALDRVIERGASLLVVGDGAQIQAIAAGSAHAITHEVAEKHGRANHLIDVRRQQGPLAFMRLVVPALGLAIRNRDAGAAAAQVRKLESVFQFAPNREAALRAGCAEYVALTNAGKDVLLLAGDRLSIAQANRIVREMLGISGGATIETADNGRLDFAVGDRIVFGKNDKRLKIDNGQLGTITDTHYDTLKRRWNVTIRRDQGGDVRIDSQRYRHLAHGYAMTAHRAQASTVWGAIVLGAGTTDAEVIHSALTRATHHLSAYVSASATPTIDDLAEAVASRMGRKTNAIQFDRVVAAQGGPDTVWARRMRKALEDERDYYRQQHAADNRARARVIEKRRAALAYRLRARVRTSTASETKTLARAHERDMAKIIDDLRPRSFVEWSARNKIWIEWRESAIQMARDFGILRDVERETAFDLERQQMKQSGPSMTL